MFLNVNSPQCPVIKKLCLAENILIIFQQKSNFFIVATKKFKTVKKSLITANKLEEKRGLRLTVI